MHSMLHLKWFPFFQHLGNTPILHNQTRHPLEILGIIGHQNQPQGSGLTGDHHVVRTNSLSRLVQSGPYLSKMIRCFALKSQNILSRNQSFHVGQVAFHLLGTLSAKHELSYCD